MLSVIFVNYLTDLKVQRAQDNLFILIICVAMGNVDLWLLYLNKYTNQPTYKEANEHKRKTGAQTINK